jgi:5-formyltetrahydrofolate cyclo-ligase
LVEKHQLRLIQRSKRQSLECSVAATQLFNNLKPLVAGVNTLAIYFAVVNEISLAPFINYCLTEGKKICAPLAYRDNRQLKFELIEDNEPREIFVPLNYSASKPLHSSELDMVILPLLAIDLLGYRLGQGGGYYDATFAKQLKRPLLCGVGYDWQILPEIPHDDWDLPLDYFVSDKQVLSFNRYRS